MKNNSVKDIEEILALAEEEINNNDEHITATLDLQDLKSLKNLYDLYKQEIKRTENVANYIKQCDWHDNDVYIGEDILDILED